MFNALIHVSIQGLPILDLSGKHGDGCKKLHLVNQLLFTVIVGLMYYGSFEPVVNNYEVTNRGE